MAYFADLPTLVVPHTTTLELGHGRLERRTLYATTELSLYETKSDLEICTELAGRLGIEGYSGKSEDEWLREFWNAAQNLTHTKPLLDYDTLKQKGVHKIQWDEPAIAFKDQIADPHNHPFPTPSGKIEIYSKQLADMNNPKLPPIPTYIETWESSNDPLAVLYPLQFISTHTQEADTLQPG